MQVSQVLGFIFLGLPLASFCKLEADEEIFMQGVFSHFSLVK
jgi:hypothetical protein